RINRRPQRADQDESFEHVEIRHVAPWRGTKRRRLSQLAASLRAQECPQRLFAHGQPARAAAWAIIVRRFRFADEGFVHRDARRIACQTNGSVRSPGARLRRRKKPGSHRIIGKIAKTAIGYHKLTVSVQSSVSGHWK